MRYLVLVFGIVLACIVLLPAIKRAGHGLKNYLSEHKEKEKPKRR